MQDQLEWENALEKFLETWKYNDITVGILVCGSFITGNPTANSDVDVHLILNSDENFRERGNVVIDNILIEYFANPPRQIQQYFQEDYASFSRMSMVQFLTGKIWKDPTGIVQDLIQIAKDWFSRPFAPISKEKLELQKYSLWDMRDNLQSLDSSHSESFHHAYYNYLAEVIDIYRKFIGYDIIKADRVIEVFSSVQHRKKYLLPPFPDQTFSSLTIKAITAKSHADQMEFFNKIIDHIFKEWNGFSIDGWTFKSRLSCKS